MGRRRIFFTKQNHVELPYAYSTGEQYVLFDFVPNITDNNELKVRKEQGSIWQGMGCESQSDIFDFRISFNIADGIIVGSSGNASNTAQFSNVDFSEDVTISMKTDEIVVNDESQTRIYSTYDVTANLCLLSLNRNGTIVDGFHGRFYYYKHWNSDGDLLFDVVPVAILSTGEVCLYDKVNKEYHRPSGEYGLSNPDIDIFEYVDYITSDGSVEIPLDIYAPFELELDMMVNDGTTRQLMGSGDLSGQNFGSSADGYWELNGVNSTYPSTTRTSLTFVVDTDAELTTLIFSDDQSEDLTCEYANSEIEHLSLFRLPDISTYGMYANLYSAKVKKDGDYVLQLLPVVLCQTGQYGLLDTINNELFVNDSTGTLTGSAT